MGLSALTDGLITFILIFRFSRAQTVARSVVRRLVSLTLETVLLTHIVGAAMCILFLASPADRRTQHPLFWILLEIITELYALSMLFTINSRTPGKVDDYDISSGGRPEVQMPTSDIELRQTALDQYVEGYQGPTPFGVALPQVGYSPGDSQMGWSATSDPSMSVASPVPIATPGIPYHSEQQTRIHLASPNAHYQEQDMDWIDDKDK
jgi:hypothetical protein